MTNQYSYELSLNILKALGGDMTVQYENTDQIWAAIDEIYAVSGDGLDLQALVLNITENGTYDYNITDEVDAYVPVNITVNVPQKYTDEQVEDLKNTAREEGYDSGYDKGIADGYVQGESEGYTDGYTEGLEDGAEDQKALLEDITIRDNGVYEKEDGYKKVTVEVPIPEIPTFETEELSVELTTNGTYNYTPTTDGYSRVNVTVDVDMSGGGGKPKIYNGTIVDGNGGLASTLNDFDFSEYDWSEVYDLKEFFSNYKSSRTYGEWSANSFNNFTEHYNGKILSGYQMFKYASGAASYAPLGDVPDFSKFSSDIVSLDGMFKECKNLTYTDNLAKWDTSNAISTQEMFYNCKNMTTVTLFDTSNVLNTYYMFYGCEKLTSIPQFNTSNVTDMNNMFSSCTSLTDVPLLDTSNVRTISSMFSSCSKLTNLGGFLNLGKVSNFTYALDLSVSTLLTKESIMNVINNLYDRKTAGHSVATLKFGSTNLAKISDEEKAIATNKGWTLS